jgi:signal transduction histidine kinase
MRDLDPGSPARQRREDLLPSEDPAAAEGAPQRWGDPPSDVLLASVAHDLRNPLGSMSMLLQLLRQKTGDADELISTMSRQVEYMSGIVEDLLDGAGRRQGALALHRDPVVIGDVVGNAVQACRSALEARGHWFAVDLPEPGLQIEADGNRLTRAIANLLVNAVLYTPPHGRIALFVRRDGIDAVEISVSDSGVGLEPERAHELGRRPGGRNVAGDSAGTSGRLGLGLWLAREIAREHAGELHVESAGPGEGSTFTLRLPLRAPRAPSGVEPPHRVRRRNGESRTAGS